MRLLSAFLNTILFASSTSTIELEQGDYDKKVVVLMEIHIQMQ